MRCYICNSVLTPNEINWDRKHKDWAPCTSCQEVIDSVFNDLTEEEIDREIDYLLFSIEDSPNHE